MKSELTLAIENLYDVFSLYTATPIDLRLNSCDCCVDDDEIREVTIKPLKELSEKELEYYSRIAICNFGTIEHYKHFLPRIFELMSKPHSTMIGDFTCFEKLNYGEWETWPEEEQNAIEHYFQTLWNTIIQDTKTDTYQIETIFDVVMFYMPNEIVFKAWEASNSITSMLFIVDSVLNGWRCVDIKNHSKSIENWLYSNVVLQKLERAFFKTKDPEIASRISITYTILEKKQPIYFNK